MNKVPTDHTQRALKEVAAIRLDSGGRRRWSTAPRRVAEILRLFRESKQEIKEFALAIGMPPSVLSRFDRGLSTNSSGGNGRERAWSALRRLIEPRTDVRGQRRPMRRPALDKPSAAGLRLRADNSIEVTERRIVPYGSEEHARLLPLAVAHTRRAA